MSNNSKKNTVIIGEHNKIIEELRKRDIDCNILKDNTDIDFSVRNHADMAAFSLSQKCLILDKRQTAIGEKLKKLGLEIVYTEEKISGAYPKDVLLNAAVISNTLICNKKYISREILSRFDKTVNVNQGYTKCSVCIVDDDAFITDDMGIYEKCKDIFDVLLIEKGDILLENKDYGFIGGASGKTGDTVYFFGSLSYHRDGEKIKAFLEKHKVKYECLFDGPLIDIGGFVEVKAF